MVSHGIRKNTASAALGRLVAQAFGILLMGSAVAGVAQSAPAATSSEARPMARDVTSVRQIVGLDLRREGVMRSFEISSDGPVIWTSYRDGRGRLVVELPNSEPTADVLALDLFDDLIKSAVFEVVSAGQRPMSRLIVETFSDVSHAVVPDGLGLVVELTPVAGAESSAVERNASGSRLDIRNTTAYQDDDGPGSLEFGPAPSGVPATQLQGVDVTTDDGTTTVSIAGDGAFYYSHFPLAEPYRFVLDLIGVVNTSPVSTIAVQGELVDGIRVAQYKPQPELVSRVVIDLVDPSMPTIEATPEGLKLTFSSAAVRASNDSYEPLDDPMAAETVAMVETPVEPAPVVPVAPTAPMAEENFDTDQAEEAEEMAATESLPQAGMTLDEPDIEPVPEEPMTAEVVAPSVEDEPVWQEQDEPTEVAWADSSESTAADTWEEAEPMEPTWDESDEEGDWEEEELPAAVPSSSLFDVSVDLSTSSEDESSAFEAREVATAGEKVYTGEPMTLSLQGADVKDVLRSFAQISGLNVVVQPGVTGSVTIEFTDVPWDQALDQILKINGLDYQLEGSIMRVAPVALLREEAEEKARLEQAKTLSIPLKTIMRRISYATAADIAGILGGGGAGSIMSDRGSALVDTRTNTLIIKELPSHIDTVIAVIENLDIPEPQVMIEARIIETTKRFSKTLGIQLGFDAVASAERGNTTGLQFPNNGTAAGGVNLLTGGQNGFLGLTLGNVLNTFNLDAALAAAESEGLINILSAPRITTLNNEQASIQSGLQIPIQTIANNTVSVQFVNATLRLDVTPHVTAEGTVLMDIDIQKREPQLAFAVVGASNAPISTKDASTRVIVRDGGTTVIGGIYKVTSDQGEDRVPGLSNVPILKHLFKNKRRNDENEELLIFITPRVVKL